MIHYGRSVSQFRYEYFSMPSLYNLHTDVSDVIWTPIP